MRWLKRLLPWLLLLLIVLSPASMAQAPSAVNVFSIWVRLSLRGLSQQEIESLLHNMDPKTIAQVKSRLRQVVMTNLELKRIGEHYRNSRDSDDLHSVRTSIETEIRFAGLQSDEQLKLMIKDRFGIQISRL
jgi:hypothetical protein